MNQKGFANIILVVVIVILVGAVGYFAFVKKSEPVAQQPTPTPIQTKTSTPTPTTKDETSSWKTYTNSSVGFSFKYPADWKVSDDGKGDINLTDSNKTYMLEGGAMSPIVIQYYVDNSGANINTYLSGGRAPLKSILKPGTIKIGGKTAYVLQGTTAPVYHDDRLVFYNGYVVSFGSNGTVLANQDTNGSINKIFSQILGTVSFVN